MFNKRAYHCQKKQCRSAEPSKNQNHPNYTANQQLKMKKTEHHDKRSQIDAIARSFSDTYL